MKWKYILIMNWIVMFYIYMKYFYCYSYCNSVYINIVFMEYWSSLLRQLILLIIFTYLKAVHSPFTIWNHLKSYLKSSIYSLLLAYINLITLKHFFSVYPCDLSYLIFIFGSSSHCHYEMALAVYYGRFAYATGVTTPLFGRYVLEARRGISSCWWLAFLSLTVHVYHNIWKLGAFLFSF